MEIVFQMLLFTEKHSRDVKRASCRDMKAVRV